MSTPDKTQKEIRRRLVKAADPETRAKVERAVPGAKAYGITVPRLRQMVLDFQREHPGLSLDETGALMDSLCRDGYREEILFGIFLLGRFGKKVAGMDWHRVESWIDALDNWETCDQLASQVSGPIVAAHLEIVDKLIALTRSDNVWKRRFAVATASELNHKGRSHPQETFRICRPLLADPEPMVWKAVGWAIREAGKKDEAAAFAFLKENRQRASSKVLREASQKMSPQRRNSLLTGDS